MLWKRILSSLLVFAVVLVMPMHVLAQKDTDKETSAETAAIPLKLVINEAEEKNILETQAMETELTVIETQAVETESTETEPQEDHTEIVEFEGRQYVIPSISLNREPGVTESGYVEKITDVPHYIQHYYRDVWYGSHGTIASHGCGITCLAMVYSYLLDQEITPPYLAERFGRYNTPVGSDWGVFTATGEYFGMNVEKTHQWKEALEALENGHMVIAQANPESIFTDGGHFILLYGLTEDGKIMVKDPSIYNYSVESSYILQEGFSNGFNHENIKYNCCPFWIFEHKDLDDIAARVERMNLAAMEAEENP